MKEASPPPDEPIIAIDIYSSKLYPDISHTGGKWVESVIQYICEHASHAHLIICGLILLAGLNIPISEDIMLLIAGAIASTCIPDQTLRMYIWIFMACWISAWEAYWIGRLLGPKLYEIRWFKHIITPKRIEKLHQYYEKFGIFTFIVGRFCPGGVRNALFMTAGLGKMPFLVFIARDGLGCLISTATIFYLGYLAGENHAIIIGYYKKYEAIFVGAVFIGLISFITFIFLRKKNSAF